LSEKQGRQQQLLFGFTLECTDSSGFCFGLNDRRVTSGLCFIGIRVEISDIYRKMHFLVGIEKEEKC